MYNDSTNGGIIMLKKESNSSLRLKAMMDILSLKQSDIVARTGITKSALSNYLHGTREPRQDQISKIAEPFNINPSWLMGYDVPMFVYDNGTNISGIEKEEKELLEMYRNLDEESKRQLVLMLAFLKEQQNKK